MAGIGPYRTCRTTLTMSLDRATADFALRIEIQWSKVGTAWAESWASENRFAAKTP